jgi:hypothetical protein
MPKLRGAYRCNGNEGCYDYEVSWHASGSTVAWAGKVRLNGKLVGMPCGEVANVSPQNHEDAVRSMIEASIATGSTAAAVLD